MFFESNWEKCHLTTEAHLGREIRKYSFTSEMSYITKIFHLIFMILNFSFLRLHFFSAVKIAKSSEMCVWRVGEAEKKDGPKQKRYIQNW